MRSRLDAHGRLIPPRSLANGVSRRRRMALEIARIESFMQQSTSLAQYQRAAAPLERFVDELSQLDAWIATQQVALLRALHALMKDMEREGSEFSAEELQVLSRLDALFAALDEPIKPAKKKP